MEERSIKMELKDNIKGIPTAEFNDNEYLENYIKELEANGVNVVLSKVDELINWGRSNSVWPLIYATSCCGIEFMSAAAAHHDISRFGMEVTRNSPRQADLMIVAGTMFIKWLHLLNVFTIKWLNQNMWWLWVPVLFRAVRLSILIML